MATSDATGHDNGMAMPFRMRRRDSLLQRRRAFHDLIDRAMLQGSHSQVNGDPTEDIPGDLLEDQVAQFFAHDHDLEDPGPAQVTGLEAGRAAQAPCSRRSRCSAGSSSSAMTSFSLAV